jgi:phage terminase Nu1 subunit (DNA packaging protein)
MKQKTISLREFARRQSVSHTAVADWIKSGMPTVEGRIDAAAASQWLRVYRARETKPAADEPAEPATQELVTQAQAELRRTLALAKLRESELAEREGKLVDVNAVAREWATVCQSIRDTLLALPERIATELAVDAEQRRRARDVAKQVVRQALTSLSTTIGAGQ